MNARFNWSRGVRDLDKPDYQALLRGKSVETGMKRYKSVVFAGRYPGIIEKDYRSVMINMRTPAVILPDLSQSSF